MQLGNQVIATKIQPPRLGIELVNRYSLLSRFDNYRDKKLTIIAAPAGYGKTVLVSQFVAQTDAKYIWYQLDSFDNDPVTFFCCLSSGISRYFPELGEAMLGVLASAGDISSKSRGILALLVNELGKYPGDRLIIVFDDFHLIVEPVICQFVEQFIEYLPEKIHLILLSRSYPAINISKAKLNGLVTEFGPQDLSFNKDEIRELLCASEEIAIADETIDAVQDKTEGWAVGLVYAKFRLLEESGWEGAQANNRLRNPNSVYDYISAEVFSRLSPELQEFLIFTSVLNEIRPEVCNAVLGRNDASELLEEIVDKNLLVSRLEGDEEGYRYHHLFQDYLQSRLGARKTEVFKKAGRYYRDVDPEQAVEYFILADDFKSAGQLIEQVGIAVLQKGKLPTVNRWFAYIESKGPIDSPYLILIKGALLSHRGFFDQAEFWIDKAINDFDSADDKEGLFNAIIYKSRILRYRTSYDESLQYIDRIMPLLFDMPIQQRYDVIIEKSFSQLWLKGDIYTAIHSAEQARNIAEEKGALELAGQIAGYMTVLYYYTGDYNHAVSIYEKSSCLYPEIEALERNSADLFIARIYRDRGELPRARQLLLQILSTKQSLGIIEDLNSIYYHLATICLDMGDYDTAVAYLKLSEDMFRQTGAGETNACFMLIQTLQGRLMLENGDLLAGKDLLAKTIDQLQGKSEFLLVVAQFFLSLAYMRLNQLKQARETITEALDLAQKIGIKYMISKCSGLLSGILLKMGDKKKALHYAEQCLKLAAAEQYVQMFVTYREFLPCVRIGLENNIAPAFIDEIVYYLGDKAVPILLDLVKSAGTGTRIRASELLLRLGGDGAAREIELMFYDPDLEVKRHGQEIFRQVQAQNSGEARDGINPDSRPRLFVCCFGDFEVYPGDDWLSPLKWRTAKARELFAYLIHNRGHYLSRENILACLWPDLDPEQASTLFHTNLFHVRKLLTNCGIENGVVFTSRGYQLDLGYLSCDAVIFDRLISGLSQVRSSDDIGLKQAVSLYRGAYLKDWDWADTARQSYEDLYVSALEDLTQDYFQLGEYKMVELYLKTLLLTNPFLESAHQLLMKTYAMMGDRVAIERQYVALCRLLREELGVEPSVHTEDLYYELCGD